jgi:hypothetical protein
MENLNLTCSGLDLVDSLTKRGKGNLERRGFEISEVDYYFLQCKNDHPRDVSRRLNRYLYLFRKNPINEMEKT